MNLNFLGVERNFSLYSERETRFNIELQQASTQEAVDIANVAFALVIDVDGVSTSAAIVSVGDGTIGVVIPSLPTGRHYYSLSATGTDGTTSVLMHGYLGVTSTISTSTSTTSTTKQTMVLGLPDSADYIAMSWRASSAVDQSISEMTAYIDREMATIKDYADDAIEQAEAAAADASATAATITGVDELYTTATLALAKLEGVETLVADIHDDIASNIYPDISTGNWVVGGQDTSATWQGQDGVDGSSIRRIIVDSLDDLPDADAYEGADIYYVPRAEAKPCYITALIPDDGFIIAQFSDDDAQLYLNDTIQTRATADSLTATQLCISVEKNQVLKFNPLTTTVYFYSNE